MIIEDLFGAEPFLGSTQSSLCFIAEHRQRDRHRPKVPRFPLGRVRWGLGHLRVYSHMGRDARQAYGRCGRYPGSAVVWGACHAKHMYAYPYLLVGSTNWSVSSEANRELSLVLEIDEEDRGARRYVETMIHSMKTGATPQSGPTIAAALRSDAGLDSRPRERAAG